MDREGIVMGMSTHTRLRFYCIFAPAVAYALGVDIALAQEAIADDVTVTVLTTNTADGNGAQGEWSFSAWVEVGDRAFLFDTGWSPNNVLMNAESP